MRSIRTRTTTFTLAIFVASLWFLSFIASSLLKADLGHQIGEQMFTTAQFVANKVNEQLKDRVSAMESVASRVSSSMMGNSQDLQDFLEDRPSFEILFNAGYFITDLNGTVLASMPTSLGRVGVNYLSRPHVAATLKDGKTHIGTPAIGKVLKTPTFGIVTPIRAPDGEVVGSLVGVIDLSKPCFLTEVTDRIYGTTGGYMLVDSDARLVIAAPDKSRTMEILVPGTDQLVDRFILGLERTGVAVDRFGIEQLVSGIQIPVSNWRLVVALPAKEAFAPIQDMQRHMVLITSILTLLAAALTWWMLKRELSPLLDTATVLAQYSEADRLHNRLPIARQDEVGALVGSFNRLLDKLKLREDEIIQLAYFDSLTGLPNRRLLEDRLKQALAASKRNGTHGALMFLDLDNFKPLNDTYGHDVGDCLLIEVAKRLTACVREVDTTARFGGDEFVVMLSDLETDKAAATEHATRVAEKIRQSLSTPYQLPLTRFFDQVNVIEHHCSACIGVVLFLKQEFSPNGILKLADAAMYEAKARGRNAICFHGSEN
jgi:diguanylate cyclase (GGDEF)-like protein